MKLHDGSPIVGVDCSPASGPTPAARNQVRPSGLLAESAPAGRRPPGATCAALNRVLPTPRARLTPVSLPNRRRLVAQLPASRPALNVKPTENSWEIARLR